MSEHELWNELGNLYFLSGSYNQATRAYNKAIQLEQNFGEAYSNLALVFVEQAKFEEAIPLYLQSLDLLTSNEEKAITWNRLGNAYRHLQNYQHAVVAYQHADDFCASLLEDDDEKPFSNAMSEAQMESQAEESSFVASQHFASDTNAPATEQGAESVLPETALDVMEKATYDYMVMVAQPELENEETYSSNGDDNFAELSQLPVDMAATSTASETDQASKQQIESIFNMPIESAEADTAQCADNLEPFVEEETPSLFADEGPQTEAFLEMAEVNPQATEPIAQAFVHLEPEEEPIEDINQDIPSSQFHSEKLSTYALDAERETDPEEKKLAQQIQLNPRSAETWEALGTLYKAAGRYEEAILAFKQAISIKPDAVSCHHNLGLVYSAQGNHKAAFIAFQTVLELDPNHSLTHASLGSYYKKMGLDELAQRHIGKAMKKIFESENEYNRACLDAICGNTDQAIDLLRVALENDQTNVDWVLHDPDLEVLREDNRFKQLIAEFSV